MKIRSRVSKVIYIFCLAQSKPRKNKTKCLHVNITYVLQLLLNLPSRQAVIRVWLCSQGNHLADWCMHDHKVNTVLFNFLLHTAAYIRREN